MNIEFKYYLFIIGLLSYSTLYADTIDVWQIRINNEVIIRSNLMEICYHNSPMKLNLKEYKETDSVKICYWTDSGLETRKWSYQLRDTSVLYFKTYYNDIDSNIRCFPDPCKTFTRRKNYIAFTVLQLRKVLSELKTDLIRVFLKHSTQFYGEDPYDGKPVCLITDQ